jgi:hypothetical protein
MESLSYGWSLLNILINFQKIRSLEERLKIAIKYLDNKRPILKIDTWNDWGEWSYIEPSRNEGFSYLEILKFILINIYIKNS